jgi:cell division protein FtsB
MSYEKLVPVIVKAMQDQQVVIEQQKKELEELKAELESLKKAVAK